VHTGAELAERQVSKDDRNPPIGLLL